MKGNLDLVVTIVVLLIVILVSAYPEATKDLFTSVFRSIW
jgi:hypothetical protein